MSLLLAYINRINIARGAMMIKPMIGRRVIQVQKLSEHWNGAPAPETESRSYMYTVFLVFQYILVFRPRPVALARAS